MENLKTLMNIITGLGMSAIWIAFIVGLFPPDPPKRKKKKKKKSKPEKPLEAYCFECEIEMPVKEKNGQLFCSNCGLIHW